MNTPSKQRFLLLLLVLCLVLMFFSIRVFAASSTHITFSSFEELRALAEKSYTDITWATYTGTSRLIIKEDLTLPRNLCVDAGEAPVKIMADVELLSVSPDFSGCLYVNNLEVSGSLVCDSLYVQDLLVIEGSLKTNNVVSISGTTEVIGASRILYGQDWAGVSCWYSIDSFSQLKQAIAAAKNTTDPHWTFHLNLHRKDICINESVSIPDNCEFYIDEEDTPLQVTIAPDCILTLDCRSWVSSALKIEGTLINRGELNVSHTENGCLTQDFNGTYLAEGPIRLFGVSSAEKKDALSGFVLSDFKENALVGPIDCLELRDPCPHKIADFSATVTEPTCCTGGYTLYACVKCSDHYITGKTKPTGQHVYNDETDADCNTCGALREIQEITDTPLFRLYNPYTLEHLFTSSSEERDLLAAAGWIFEGTAWWVPDSGEPVYRLYNPYGDSHFYTVSQEEIDTLLPLGWKLDGVMCYSTEEENSFPIRRLFNPYEDNNYHLYTISQEECDMLVPLGWILEGVAWYGILK